MKNLFTIRKLAPSRVLLSIFTGLVFLLASLPLCAQDEDEASAPATANRPVRATFESAIILDNQTVMVPIKGTFEFDIQHRFGTFQNGFDDLYGLYAPSNIRLGFLYAPINNLSLGVGITKFKNLVDFNAKYSLMKQRKGWSSPLSVTYFGNMVLDSRKEAVRGEAYHETDRLSYFHQLLIARKVNDWLSLQVAPSLSHYNLVDETKKNDHYAIAFSAQLKVTPVLAILAAVDQPITAHDRRNPNPNLSLGLQMSTSSHSFQIFIGNFNSIIPQENNYFNNRNYEDGFKENFLLGFNITRLWNF